MNPTPEQQRQEMERFLGLLYDHSRLYGAVLENSHVMERSADWRDGVLNYIRSLQASNDTLLREHGEMRKALVLVKPKCGVGCDCAVSVALSSIPDRSVRDQDRCSCSPIRGEAHEWPCGHPNCYRLSSSDRSVPPTA